MKIERNPLLEEYRLNQMRKNITSRKGDPIHASEVDFNDKGEGCLQKAYYRRTLDPPSPLLKTQLLNFASGWGIEGWVILPDERREPKEKEGIICSIDAKPLKFSISEFKSCDYNCDTFHPKNASWWINRMGMYAYVWDEDTCNLEVFFNRGNYKFGPKGIKKDLRAWTIYFTKENLASIWSKAQQRKTMLEKALEIKLPIPFEYIKPYVFSSGPECLGCELAVVCDYYEKKVMMTDKEQP